MSGWPLCSDSATDPDKVNDKDNIVNFKEAKETGTAWEMAEGEPARLTEDVPQREEECRRREGTVNFYLQQRPGG